MTEPPKTPRLDHGAIGNGRVLALVSPTSAIEWCCLPHFDSGSVFARLLDRERGGVWRFVREDGSEVAGSLAYLTNTNVLVGTFRDGDAAWQVIDFAPRIPAGLGVDAPREIVRLIRPLAGRVRLRMDFDPRPDYGRAEVSCVPEGSGVGLYAPGFSARLESNLSPQVLLSRRAFTVEQPCWFALRYGREATERATVDVERALELTTAGWRAWAQTCALPPFAPAEVLRSALCLKLHIAIDTGAIIAAATTSVPEAMGTVRTWDYRYCWLRDAAFVVEALRRLSHIGEGESFLRFLRAVAEDGPLQPLYGIDGRRSLDEEILPHLAGFGGNGPVRVGNAASTQCQNDLMGELLLCLDALLGDPRLVLDDAKAWWPLVRRLVEEAIAAAPTPDTSIWEFRSILRPYTFSRAMCWAAVHRGARLARRFEQVELAERWAKIAEEERGVILARGYNAAAGFFTQALDGEHPDASNLLLPIIGLIDARDPRFQSTLDRYRERLVDRGLMLRYRNDDDFGETTSAFTICSFWWAETLALAGRVDEAAEVFYRVRQFANPLGLFSEDVDPESGTLLGNFPQAYTHVGLIHAAMTIGDILAARSGGSQQWV